MGMQPRTWLQELFKYLSSLKCPATMFSIDKVAFGHNGPKGNIFFKCSHPPENSELASPHPSKIQ